MLAQLERRNGEAVRSCQRFVLIVLLAGVLALTGLIPAYAHTVVVEGQSSYQVCLSPGQAYNSNLNWGAIASDRTVAARIGIQLVGGDSVQTMRMSGILRNNGGTELGRWRTAMRFWGAANTQVFFGSITGHVSSNNPTTDTAVNNDDSTSQCVSIYERIVHW